MKTVTLSFSIVVNADQKTIFDYVSDWERQSEWILFTTVKDLSPREQPQDHSLLAITKFGPIRLVDTMIVTAWKPYDKIVVEHTGRIVLGKGVFTVTRLSQDSCEFTWREITPVPFGLLGQAVLLIFRPLIRWPFMKSLKTLKAIIEAR